MAAVIEPRIVGSGRDEADWRRSPWLAALPVLDDADVLQGRARVVVLSPHPDDETLACGGLLRAAAARGMQVVLLAATDGEACYPDDPAWTAERLRDERPRETRAALDVLGIDARVHRLRLPDGGLARHIDRLVREAGAVLRADDLVLATWERDGHPDHDAIGTAALRAARDVGARLLRYPVWAWHWLEPHAARAPFAAFKLPLDAAALAAKARAIACFASQLGTADAPVPQPILPAHVVARFERPYEVYLP